MAGQELGERERKSRVEARRSFYACFGKWFTENFFLKQFSLFFFFFFHEGFSDQLQIIYVDFSFTAKQTLTNDKNVLRKMFYVKTNGT